MNEETSADKAPLFPWPAIVLFAGFLIAALYWRFAAPTRPEYLDRPAPRGFQLLGGESSPSPAAPPPRAARARPAPVADLPVPDKPRASADPFATVYSFPGDGPVAEAGPGGVFWSDRNPPSRIVYVSNAADAPPGYREPEEPFPSRRPSEPPPPRPAGPRVNDPNEERFEAPGQYR